jgi:para-aminobenzoate synthetase/4-amino-4-deoxychorismate lyase
MNDSILESQDVCPQARPYKVDIQGVSTPLDLITSTSWHALPGIFRVLAAENPGAILLETAKRDSDDDKSLLFLDPIEELIARTPQELDELLRDVDRHVDDGKFVAGFFSYECGEHFVGLPLGGFRSDDSHEPLAWLGVFCSPIEFDHRTGTTRGTLPPIQTMREQREDAVIRTSGLQITRANYEAAIASIRRYLHEGHTYQVNFTDRVEGETDANPLSVYQTLLRQQPVPFAAYVNSPSGPLLSFSPELFFRTAQERITVRPMKGTWPRGRNLAEDNKARRQLLNDAKNRSEHVMIVDLLRNDLGRICTYGSVRVDELFHVERYNTLLQMTSTCSGRLREGLSPAQVLMNLFPSGSITGAPKRRTMEIIRELERHPRGVYTGCIGFFGPGGESCFNVAIRTVKLHGGRLTMGVGGGITADSKPEEEFEECKLKAEFLTRKQTPFSLFETMRSVNGEISLLSLHMQRLSDSANYFGFRYDRNALWSELVATALHGGSSKFKLRLVLNRTGNWTISATPLEFVPWGGRLLLSNERTQAKDVFLHHKTTMRELYDRCLADARHMGFDEVLFLNEGGSLTEGAISSIFLQAGDRWMTPSLQSGVLPGVQRSHLLGRLQNVEERELSLDDLIDVESVYLCNALRGMRSATSIETADGAVLWKKR